MAAMARALRPGGRLMALVPAHPRLYGSLDRAYGHERRYTPDRLRSIVEGAGLAVERLYTSTPSASPAGGRATGPARAASGRPRCAPTRCSFAAWRPIERRVDLPFGLSLIAHARRAA